MFEPIHTERLLLQRPRPGDADALWERRTRGSYRVGDESTGDLLYGMTRTDWSAWVGRRSDPPADVSLVEITPETAPAVSSLTTDQSKRGDPLTNAAASSPRAG